jgi:hypothetical protein
MSSEWLKVMLDEISRKKAEDEEARAEERRREEQSQSDKPIVRTDDSAQG